MVWNDLNRNGLQDANEPGVADVEIDLIDANGVVVDSTKTSSSGVFSFVDVSAGEYSLRFNAADEWNFTKTNAGNESRDSDADSTGLVDGVELAAGEHNFQVDVGLFVDSTYLANLELEGAGIVFNPVFSPLINRYSINPTADTGTISLTAHTRGATVRVNGQRIAPRTAFEINDLTPGDVITITLSYQQC